MSDPLKRHHVTIAGNPASPRTMVFVHGFGTDQRAWSEVARAFADDFRIVLFDNMGAGQTSPDAFVEADYLNLQRYARDFLDICAVLRLTNIVAVGHSLGAMICVLAALKKPEHFAKLVLIGASPRYMNDGDYRGGFDKADLDALYSAMALRYSEWADGFAGLAMANPDRPSLAEHFAQSLQAIPPKQALTVLCSIFQTDHRADIARLKLPTLLIQTKEDIVVPPAVAEYLHANIPGSELRVIDATGHLPHISAPQAVIDAMKPFV